jgi:putative copper export protein
MILEYLQPDPNLWDGLTVVMRAAYYAATLGAAGLVLVLIALGDHLQEEELARVRRWIVMAAAAGLVLSFAAFGLRAMVLSKDGFAGLARFELYPVIARSRIGDAFFIRVAGLLLVMAAAARGRWALPVAAVGAVAICASYTAMGHTMLYRPRQELAGLVMVHLLAVSFWIASLPVLRLVLARPYPAEATPVFRAFSRQAIIIVPLLAAIGLVAAWYLVGRIDLLLTSWYGWGLIAKVALVSMMLGLGAWHRWRAVPDLEAGVYASAERLRITLTVEMGLALLVLYAAAEMVSVHPIDYGHRIPS